MVQGLLLAESQTQAASLAVDRIKSEFGSGSRVKLVVPVIDAGEIRRVRNTGLHALLAELDQIRFVAWHLHKQTRRMARLVAELISTVRESQTQGGQDA